LNQKLQYILAAEYADRTTRKEHETKKAGLSFVERQPGYPLRTRGFPSPPLDGFGFCLYLIIIERLSVDCENPVNNNG
jgi:hypothetical protein